MRLITRQAHFFLSRYLTTQLWMLLSFSRWVWAGGCAEASRACSCCDSPTDLYGFALLQLCSKRLLRFEF